MTNPHNVDICVTCVSEKPPQLPLREELPSLGIEVVYNARGVGAKASRQEQKKKQKEYQSEKDSKKKFAPGRFFFGGKNKKKDEERKRKEEELKVPHALSYTSYQQKLDSILHDSSSLTKGDESSSVTTSTNTSSKPPIADLQFPTESAEDLAVKEAFNVFSDNVYESAIESRNGGNDSSRLLESREPASPGSVLQTGDKAEDDFSDVASRDTSTLESLHDLAQQFLSKHIPKSLSSHDSSRPSDEGRVEFRIPQPPSNGSMTFDDETTKEELERPQKILDTSESNTTATKSHAKHVRVSKVNQNDTVSEFYDLTAISDEDNTGGLAFQEESNESGTFTSGNDLSTLSSMREFKSTKPIQVFPSAAIREQLPGLKLQIPQEDDGYGHIVLDLSDVLEENGPASHLVFSPSHEQTGSFENPEDLTGYVEAWEQVEGSRDDAYGADIREDYVAGAEDVFARKMSVLENERRSPMESNPYLERDGKDQFFLPTANAHTLMPSLMKASSRDLDPPHHKLSVSFSHDVEARYYLDEDQIHSFDDVSAIEQKRRRKAEIAERVLPVLEQTKRDPSPEQERTDRFMFAESKDQISDANSRDQEVLFLEALDLNEALPAGIEQIVIRNPSLAFEKLERSRTYPLHAACARDFDDKFERGQPCLVQDLVNDIVLRKSLITALARADPDICITVDANGDLPVHIIARQMMEWEARWYQKVYENAKEDGSEKSDNGAGITTLYQTMSQIVDVLLKPLSRDGDVCREAGGVGFILPLHIASMFTISYDTLKMLIEKYPEATQQKCNLGEIRTFIPNYSIPLELHNRLSTDFPKWEIDGSRGENEHEIQWTQSTLDQSYGTIGALRRSDLMFAYFPTVLPYRNELPRIRRLESRIRTEVQVMEVDADATMSEAVRLIWEWMCTFEGDDYDDHYADSISRIVKPLALSTIRTLVTIPSSDSKPMIDVALSKCVDSIKNRLAEIANTEIPVPMAPLATGFASHERSSIIREYDVNMATRFCLQGRGFVGVLCRTLFNISETLFPTNFIFLPYKLVKDSDGRLGLDSAEAAATAMKFADSLLHLTDPDIILHFLEKKAVRFIGTSLGIQKSNDWDSVEEQLKEHVSDLLSLYENKQAYFYFLDEYTGAPIVPEGDDSAYPLMVTEAADTVRKVLPMMLGGMILMRGEKALPIMAKVLLNENVKLVQEHWIEAAKDLAGYLYSPQTEWTPGFLVDLRPLRSNLIDFIERGVSRSAPPPRHNDLTSEWVVEGSLVKMIVEMHDANHTLCGLRSRRAGLQVLWTKESAFLDPASNEHLMQIDFNSLKDLREQSEELDEGSNCSDSVVDDEDYDGEVDSEQEKTKSKKKKGEDSYELLFRELALYTSGANDESRWAENPADNARGSPSLREGDNGSSSSSHSSLKDDYGDLASQLYESTYVPEPPAIVRRRMPSTTPSEPISLINFDDDDVLNLDSVLQVRILLDEQEAKLEFLKEKVDDLGVGETELHEEEERLGDLLDNVNNQKENMLETPPIRGLTTARNLLLRICELEDRVLCREVEVGQLKNDISCFELEAAEKKEMDFLYDIL